MKTSITKAYTSAGIIAAIPAIAALVSQEAYAHVVAVQTEDKKVNIVSYVWDTREVIAINEVTPDTGIKMVDLKRKALKPAQAVDNRLPLVLSSDAAPEKAALIALLNKEKFTAKPKAPKAPKAAKEEAPADPVPTTEAAE